jgi:hypothetical protein
MITMISNYALLTHEKNTNGIGRKFCAVLASCLDFMGSDFQMDSGIVGHYVLSHWARDI